MLSKVLESFGFNRNKARLRAWTQTAQRIGALEQELTGLDDVALRSRAQQCAASASRAGKAPKGRDPLLEECFALGREASRRLLGMRHFDAQLIGALALHEGMLAEMKTGEGKSLCLTLAAIYNSLRGDQVHVVTVNEYLARRDATEMAPLYGFFGLSVGLLEDSHDARARNEQYERDVVYGVNHEFGFDYLRHNMARSAGERRMNRGLGFAIVDEVDSILIDEARTPLIISGEQDDDLSVYAACWAQVASLPSQMVDVDEKRRQASLTEEGFERVERGLMESGSIERGHHLYEPEANGLMRALQACLQARFLFRRDEHYIVEEGRVLIVDENTGRLMADRRWSGGLHQAMEVKEGAQPRQESETLATITYQNFFKLYGKLSGLTGTALTQSQEFWEIYGLETIEIPTHRPMIRMDWPDAVFRTEAEKFEALAREAKAAVEAGRPVLAGTSSVEESEKLSKRLDQLGVEHQLLNAKNHQQEARLIEDAGMRSRVTVATNMAGRGTDIVLGGHWAAMLARLVEEGADAEAIERARAAREAEREEIIKAGGLLVLGCARNDSRRVDNQLRGRAGRQGDPGESKFIISLEDGLFRVYAQNGVLALIDRHGMMPPGSSLQHPMLSRSLDRAQKAVENHHYDMRKQLQDYDGVGAAQRRLVYGWRDEMIDASDADAWAMAWAMVEQAVETAGAGPREAGLAEAWLAPGAFDALGAVGPLDLDQARQWVDQAREPEDVEGWALARWREDFDRAKELDGAGAGAAALRSLMLDRVDEAWQAHLTTLQGLMDGIHLRSYVQKDPKQEYRREGYEMFGRLRSAIVERSAQAALAWALGAPGREEERLGALEQAAAESVEGGQALFAAESGWASTRHMEGLSTPQSWTLWESKPARQGAAPSV
jgi:preprotein translocase subunit SecA